MNNRSFARFAGNNPNPLEQPDDSLQQVTDEIYGRGSDLPFKPRVKVDEKALVPRDGGGFIYKRFELAPTGLLIPEDVSEPELNEIGWALKGINDAVSWWVGDWALVAMQVWKCTASEVAKAFEYAPETVETYAWVCGGIPGSIRNRAVFFSHHRHVAKMDEELQRVWLSYAEFFISTKVGLKVAEFKQDITALDLKDRDEKFQYIYEAISQSKRLSQFDDLKPPALLLPPLPAEVKRGTKDANQAMKSLVGYVGGRLDLNGEQIREKGRAAIRWIEALMEARG